MDVGIEERIAYFTRCFVNMAFGDSSLPGQIF
jgi:hypothetical protein